MEGVEERKSWTRWLQSDVVLSAARTIYLWAACLSGIVIIVGLAAVVLIQLFEWRPTPEVSVPPEYVAPPRAISLDTVARTLQPPSNVRFVVTRSIAEQVGENVVLGYFDADTPSGLGSFPDDFDVLGGRDADLFDRVVATPGRAGLRPTAALVAQLNGALSKAVIQQPRQFTLMVVARDRFGNASKPASVVFNLLIGPEPKVIVQQQAPAPQPITGIQQLADAIASHLDPSRSDTYFNAYRRALKVPQECGASDDDQSFLEAFGSAFAKLRPQLRQSNIEAFYAGVCAAWSEVIAREARERQQIDQARADAIGKNMMARAAAETENTMLGIAKYTALGMVGVAVSAFLTISLFLAFLAIENHSKAIREAMQALVAKTPG